MLRIDNVSIVILTMNSEKYLALTLETLRNKFTEIIVGIDTKSNTETKLVATRYATKVIIVENDSAYMENALGQLYPHCSNNWILRIDDDEFVSDGLVLFIKEYLPTLDVEAVAFHRKWMRFNKLKNNLEYSLYPRYGYDWQWRLFRRDLIKIDTRIHTPGIVFKTHTKAPLSGFIAHMDWIYHDYAARRRKVERYKTINNNLCHKDYYLYEDIPNGEQWFTKVYEVEFLKLTKEISGLFNIFYTDYIKSQYRLISVSTQNTTMSITKSDNIEFSISITNKSYINIQEPSFEYKLTGDSDFSYTGKIILPHSILSGEVKTFKINIAPPTASGNYLLEVSSFRDG